MGNSAGRFIRSLIFGRALYDTPSRLNDLRDETYNQGKTLGCVKEDLAKVIAKQNATESILIASIYHAKKASLFSSTPSIDSQSNIEAWIYQETFKWDDYSVNYADALKVYHHYNETVKDIFLLEIANKKVSIIDKPKSLTINDPYLYERINLYKAYVEKVVSILPKGGRDLVLTIQTADEPLNNPHFPTFSFQKRVVIAPFSYPIQTFSTTIIIEMNSILMDYLTQLSKLKLFFPDRLPEAL